MFLLEPIIHPTITPVINATIPAPATLATSVVGAVTVVTLGTSKVGSILAGRKKNVSH